MNIEQMIAEKVMGWRLVNYDTGEAARTPADYASAAANDGWTWSGRVGEAWEWQPTTDIACAFEIVEHLRNRNAFLFNLVDGGPFGWTAAFLTTNAFSDTGDMRVDGDTIEHAIINAALKAFKLDPT